MATSSKKHISNTLGKYKFDFKTENKSVFQTSKGITEKIIEEISKRKNEPNWMTEYRLKAFEIFKQKPLPKWGVDISKLNFDDILYYIQPQDSKKTRWEDVPKAIKYTFEKIGIPSAEKKFLSGVGAQFESEMVYHSLQKTLRNQGIIFESTEAGLQKYPELFKEYFGTVVPSTDNKFAALNSAVWSGGSFIYIPKGVKIELPLQAYFRMNAEKMGQFERTLIIADEGSQVHYVEGCTAPIYTTDSLHSAVVEIIVKKNARVQYTTLQNWSHNIYNLVTKRAIAYKNAEMLWLDCNIGSKKTMKYPAIYLMEEGAKGEIQSLAFSNKNQHQDTGAKIFHFAPNTKSKIISKSICKDDGINTYRGIIKVPKGSKNAQSHISCNALLLDKKSRSDTYPTIKIEEKDVTIEHEATISRIGEDQLFYMMTRGLNEEEAKSTIVNGFADPIIKKLPMEYALELNRLLEIELTESTG